MKKAIIGIVSTIEYVMKGNYKKEVISVNSDYINMIEGSGGIPLIIPSTVSEKDILKIADNIDGLLLIGGEDVGEQLYKKTGSKISNRDKLEAVIYKYCKDKDIPILGICRGMQIINVLEGGTLTNIKEEKIRHFIEDDGWINYHNIVIKDNTKLEKIISKKEYVVSSVHHQKVNKVGKDIIVNAISEDGIVEGIEVANKKFIMGFQGHIEKCLVNYKEYKKIIDLFIKESENGKR